MELIRVLFVLKSVNKHVPKVFSLDFALRGLMKIVSVMQKKKKRKQDRVIGACAQIHLPLLCDK